MEYLRNITDRLTEYTESLANLPNTTLLTLDSEQHDITKDSGQKELLSLLQSILT